MNTGRRFLDTQFAFAAHLRDPVNNPVPGDIEDRRMGIYRELIYNNIESFIASGFPVLRELLDDDIWHGMVRDFISRHRSHTPYFMEIGREFLQYLQEERRTEESDPPFLLELAHYEWVELALDVSSEELPANTDCGPSGLMDGQPKVSPLAWSLSYQYPVHRISPEYQPAEPPQEPTFLVVYRNRADKVKFLEANGVTIRLLQLLAEGRHAGKEALGIIAEETHHPNLKTVLESGRELMERLYRLDILYI